ncbi:glycine cleavage system aminomethyltransferase GcvT [Homoserinimonas sp. OAct 916]|uniref:glycine cleavage system aminomethyltransferase GcvT n=1 Tax=Homoserinimonas sp. OAct 916 TaxID=2211450 RepID=UPI000DBE0F4B|nr:glycine cleavage system aminomethyltransferase GcvT [Homoserinimonas sp. OAct 916]
MTQTSSSTGADERHSPLHEVHVAQGATFTDFAGWQMPVRYTSDLAEHHAVRTAAGVFDVSHMGNVVVSGSNAAKFLDYALAGNMSLVKPMQAKYSLMLDENAGIIDDLIVYHTAPDEYMIVPNAGNRAAVVQALTERVSTFDGVSVRDISDDTAIFALQGPNAVDILQSVAPLAVIDGQPSFSDLKNYWATGARYGEGTVLVARTGYTGEDGFELYVDAADAVALWTAIQAAGESYGLVPAGLACRDTLRLEAGFPLYGHELTLDILPVQAGLGRVVSLKKESDFVGRAAVEKGPDAGARVLVGLAADGKRAARADYDIYLPDAADGEQPIGRVTSGALSPTLGHPIAMAFVAHESSAAGTQLSVDIRGKRLPYTVTELPFYSRKKN